MPFAAALVVLVGCLVGSAAAALQPREIAALALPSVLLLEFTDDGYKTRSQGSGFLVAPGVVATSYHLVEGLTSGKIQGRGKIVGGSRFVDVTRLLAEDPDHDLLLLAVDVGAVQPLRIGTPTQLAIGDPLFAAGNPLGAEGTFSAGILSQRRVDEGVNLLQITAPVSPGSSGGPILDERGEVIGVLMGTFEGGQNLNLAVSVVHLVALMATVPNINQPGTAAPAGGAIQALDIELYGQADVINVRAQPTTDAEILARVNRGTPVTVTGRTGDWYRVQLADRRTGYVLNSLLGPQGGAPAAVAAAPPRTATPAAPTPPPPQAAAAGRTVALRAGFLPDPYFVELTAGGNFEAAARAPGCKGFIADAPDFVVTLGANTTYFVSAHSEEDTTLVVRTPSGAWLCDDDGAGDSDPLVRLEVTREGTYSVWVGTYDRTAYPDAAIIVSELGIHGLQLGYHNADLAAGFPEDPFTLELVAGGGKEAADRSSGCSGYMSERPDFVLDYDAGALPLHVYVLSKSDTTLVVRTPDGDWLCDDDGMGGVDPLVTIDAPTTGTYAVWVGTYTEDEFPDAVLHVTELAP